MSQYTLTHLPDAVLLRDLAEIVARNRDITATLLAHIAEVDVRRLYVAAGYSSMFAYCLEELRLSEDGAYKRIRAARAARQFPALFIAVADGRLHLTAVSLIAPHLTVENLGELIEAATHRRKSEIEGWLARRFPLLHLCARERVMPVIRPIAQLPPGRVADSTDPLALRRLDGGSDGNQLALGRVADETEDGQLAPGRVVHESDGDELALGRVPEGSDRGQLALERVPEGSDSSQLALGRVAGDSRDDQLVPGPASDDPNNARRTPDAEGSALGGSGRIPVQEMAPERYLVQLTISKSTHDKLRHAQALLSHVVPTGDVAQVLDRALEALIGMLERRKIGAATRRPTRQPSTSKTGRCRTRSRSSLRNRYIPAPIRREVWERDKGRCTYVGAAGHRCTARKFLEFDHVEPVARGGKATVDGLRLRCRVHNQYEADRAFGADFMNRKRREARMMRGEADLKVRVEDHDPTQTDAPETQDRLGGRADPR